MVQRAEKALRLEEVAVAMRAAEAFASAKSTEGVGLPASLRFDLAALQRALEPVYKPFMEGQLSAVERYAERDEDGAVKQPAEGQFFIPKEKREAFNQDMRDLATRDVTVSYIPIPIGKYLQRLDDDRIDVPAGALEALWPFFATE